VSNSRQCVIAYAFHTIECCGWHHQHLQAKQSSAEFKRAWHRDKWAKLRDREHHPLMHVHWTFQSSSVRRGVPTPLVVTYCPTIWKIAWLNNRSHQLYTVHFLPITKVQRLTTPDGFQVWTKKVATCMTNPSQCITAHVFDNIGRSWQHNQHLQVFPNSWNSTEYKMG
jgi:hypothetical protein